MAKKESTLLQLTLVLVLITAIAGIGLAAVYSITQEPIEKSQVRKKKEAIALVLPDYKGSEFQDVAVTLAEDKEPVIVHLAYQDKELYGAAVETYTDKAFSGSFHIMVGIDANGTILGTEVLKMSETPGLGDKIDKTKSDFSKQFLTKNPADYQLKVKKDGGDVDAITAATISSRAFCDAVQRACNGFLKAKEENSHE
ncbi:MAG: RnfABCDGE type electron transport complex subunit G [Bacteroidales bacterium]|jgi:electron transport complex protein RnfG|nr:RnfABCDGE type electron transport complex subunit G [Bacteroidales bacterium]